MRPVQITNGPAEDFGGGVLNGFKIERTITLLVHFVKLAKWTFSGVNARTYPGYTEVDVDGRACGSDFRSCGLPRGLPRMLDNESRRAYSALRASFESF
jgi:hypothetical protein